METVDFGPPLAKWKSVSRARPIAPAGPTSDSYSTIFQYESLRITFPLRNV